MGLRVRGLGFSGLVRVRCLELRFARWVQVFFFRVCAPSRFRDLGDQGADLFRGNGGVNGWLS